MTDGCLDHWHAEQVITVDGQTVGWLCPDCDLLLPERPPNDPVKWAMLHHDYVPEHYWDARRRAGLR